MTPDETQLHSKLETALRARDKDAAKVLRNILAAVQNKRIELRLANEIPLKGADLIAILKREAKQARESLGFAEEAGRSSLVEEARTELVLLEEMLPSQLSGDTLRTAIEAILEETGADSIGPVMKALGERHAGSYDGREASQTVMALIKERTR